MKHLIQLLFLGLITNYVSAQGIRSQGQSMQIHNSLTGFGLVISQHYEIDGIMQSNSKGNSITFGPNSSWKRVGKGYIEGNVTSRKKADFLFPVGDKNIYRPLRLSNSTNAIVYYQNQTAPNIKQFNTNEIDRISEVEHWNISSINTSKITLTYDKESLISELTGEDLTKLTIVGWNGTNWSRIDSEVDNLIDDLNNSISKKSIVHSTAEQGSISSINEVNLKGYTYFTLASYHTTITSEIDLFSKIDNEMKPYNLLKRIHFAFNSKDLSEYSINVLSKISAEIKKNPNSKIKLVGHADFYGSASYNYALGLKRSESIKNYLSTHGINNVEIDVRSEGENDPKVLCQTCPSRFMVLNRRVDIYILEN